MRNWMIVFALILVILCFAFVKAEEADAGISSIDENQIENIENMVENIPIDEQGNFDEDKADTGLRFGLSKAEERIQKINVWLKGNASWLSFIFRTPVELSWLFVFNFYFIILALTGFILNAQKVWFFISSPGLSYLFGLAVFAVGLFTGIYLYAANLSLGIIVALYNLVITTLWVGVISSIILIIIGIVLLIFAPGLLVKIVQFGVKAYYWIVNVFAKISGNKKIYKNFGEKVDTEEIDKKLNESEEQIRKMKAYTDSIAKSFK